jgi:hypothetical protein
MEEGRALVQDVERATIADQIHAYTLCCRRCPGCGSLQHYKDMRTKCVPTVHGAYRSGAEESVRVLASARRARLAARAPRRPCRQEGARGGLCEADVWVHRETFYAGNSDCAEKDFKRNPSTRGWARDMIISMTGASMARARGGVLGRLAPDTRKPRLLLAG